MCADLLSLELPYQLTTEAEAETETESDGRT